MEHWIRALPQRFNVARGAGGEVLAFYVFARDDDGLDTLAAKDPLLRSWRAHLAQNPVSGATLFMRQLLAADPAEHAPERAACILDLKRAYFERWDLSRVYAAASAGTIAGPVMRRLGFRPLSTPRRGAPGSIVLDLPGSGLIDWVAALVGSVARAEAGTELRFARDRREVTIGGAVVQLTPLEAGVLAMLMDRAPAVVTREALIETVWQRAFVGSNVVDAVIRTLRRKLAAEKHCVVTVPKSGYRFISVRERSRAVESKTPRTSLRER
jgi:DNA-binding winged helix-turn-helix (wHTH) protein